MKNHGDARDLIYMERDQKLESARNEEAREKIATAATEAIAGALPGMLDAAMPDMPKATGGVIPMGEGGPRLP